MGAKLCFLLFRQNATVVQGVVTATEDEDVSELMVRFCESLQRESIVLVEGVVKKAEQEVKSADRHDVEIEVKRLYVISQVTHGLPFNVGDAGRPLDDARDGLPSLSTRTKLEHRMLDLRTAVNKSIFRIQAAMSKYARQYLEERDFLEIHSAKLQSSATESGASVFRVDYFKRAAFLAQSPQAGKGKSRLYYMRTCSQVFLPTPSQKSRSVLTLSACTRFDPFIRDCMRHNLTPWSRSVQFSAQRTPTPPDT